MINNKATKKNPCEDDIDNVSGEENRTKAKMRNQHQGEQFSYDTPFGGGSAYDKAAIKAAKEGKWLADDQDVEEAKQEVKRELGEK